MSGALATEFAADIQRVHLKHFDFEKLLDRLSDLRFVRPTISDDGVLIETFALARAFFGEAHCLDNLEGIHGS